MELQCWLPKEQELAQDVEQGYWESLQFRAAMLANCQLIYTMFKVGAGDSTLNSTSTDNFVGSQVVQAQA